MYIFREPSSRSTGSRSRVSCYDTCWSFDTTIFPFNIRTYIIDDNSIIWKKMYFYFFQCIIFVVRIMLRCLEHFFFRYIRTLYIIYMVVVINASFNNISAISWWGCTITPKSCYSDGPSFPGTDPGGRMFIHKTILTI